MAVNIPGLLGRIAELPGVINQGLLGPLPVDPRLEQMIGPAQVQAQRQQAQNDFAMSLLNARGNGGLPAAAGYAQQGFQGRVFDLLKQQEAARMMAAQQAEMERQRRFAQNPTYANLPMAAQENIVAQAEAASRVPVDPNIAAREAAELRVMEKRADYEMRLQAQRDAADMRIQQMKALADAQGGMTPAQQSRAEQSLRKEYRGLQSVQAYEMVLPLIESAKKAPDSGYGDLQLIYTVGKALDPASVVREGELKLTLAASDPVSQVLGQAQFVLRSGGRLTKDMRAQIIDMLEQRTGAYKQAYERDFAQYSQYARELGVEPETIVGTPAQSAYKQSATSFATEAEAQAAADRGELKPGTRVTIGGVSGTWQ